MSVLFDRAKSVLNDHADRGFGQMKLVCLAMVLQSRKFAASWAKSCKLIAASGRGEGSGGGAVAAWNKAPLGGM